MGSAFADGGFVGISIGPVSLAGSGASLFSKRTLPVWLRVRTGSASAINCSMFFIGAAGGAGGPMTTRAGGRRTTPCVAGKVRVPDVVGEA